MDTRPPLTLQIVQARLLNPLIRELRLRAPDGGALPPFEPGAHLRVQVRLPDGSSDWRAYSLIRFDDEKSAAPTEYRIAVRLEAQGRGGSRFMHDVAALAEGGLLQVEPPKNDFALQAHAGCVWLLAGGIGVTPLIAMAARRRAQGLPVRMFYAGRSRAQLAYLDELQALLGPDLQLHLDDEAGAPPDIAALLAGMGAQDALYVCGPAPMLEAAQAQAAALGWPPGRLHFEVFNAPAAQQGDHAFELVLAASGRTLQVGAEQTILQCLIDAGCDPIFDCQRGECGVCAAPVLEGEIDHRDFVLTAREKAEGTVIQTCVSRAKGTRLVLDL